MLGGLSALPLARHALAATGADLDESAARAGRAIDAALAAFPAKEEQRRLLTGLRDAKRPGALHLSDGMRWYTLQLQRQLGTVDPIVVERRLAAELLRLQRRAGRLFTGGAPATASTGDRFDRMWAQGLYDDSDAGREAAVADMNRALDRQRARAPALLGSLPPAALTVAVRRMPGAEEAAGKSGYRILPAVAVSGATTRAAYVVDLKDISRRPAWTLASVVAHELLPGHMAQLPVEALTPPSPERLDYAQAFVEGWAIYAETLAAADGAFATRQEMLGHLHWMIFRVGRALVDLGIHLHGWTLAEAKAKLIGWQGPAAYFAPYDTDLARIAIEPGVRAAEALASLGIADRAAGARDRAAFHRAVLAGGRKRLEQLP